MEKKLTLQTSAAFERIHDSLLGKTDDDLDELMFHIEKLSEKIKEVKEISACMMSGDC